jgi:hypothetical protein
VPLPAEPQLSLPGLALAHGDELGQCLRRHTIRRDEHVGEDRCRGDRNEILLQVVGQRLVRRGGHGAVHGVQQHRVAVGWCLGRQAGADRAAGAAAVVDHHLLAEDLRQLGRQGPRDRVRAAPGREGHDHANGPGRPFLRLHGQNGEQGDGEQGTEHGDLLSWSDPFLPAPRFFIGRCRSPASPFD